MMLPLTRWACLSSCLVLTLTWEKLICWGGVNKLHFGFLQCKDPEKPVYLSCFALFYLASDSHTNALSHHFRREQRQQEEIQVYTHYRERALSANARLVEDIF